MTTSLPLAELFYELREPLSLQIDQFHMLMEAIEQGFGCAGVDDLKETCRLLWLKAHHSREDRVFEQVFADFIHRHTTPLKDTTEDSQASVSSQTQDNQSNQNSEPKIDQQTSVEIIEKPEPKPSLTQSQNLPTRPPKLPPKVATAFEKRSTLEPLERSGKYVLKASDFPFEERPTRHSWRKLSRPQRLGQSSEIDIKPTIDRAIQQGFLFKPVWKKSRVNQTDIVFLEDREGSMVPFRPVIDELFRTIEPEKFHRVYRYYFRNCPGDFVYCQAKGTEVLYLDELPLRGTQTVLVIVSDAGAMRGGFNPERLEMTQTFFTRMQSQVSGIAWVNPLPAERWQGTTAAAIDQFLLNGRMFELPADGIQQAVRAVKGGRG